MLSERCPVCPVCDVGVLWPNGWMDQNETWRAGRNRPWPHCVRWGPSFSSPKFSAYVYCGQTAGWIKIALGTEVGLGPGHNALDGDPVLPPRKRGHSPQFSAHVCCVQMAGLIKMPLNMMEVGSAQITLCYMGTQLPPQKRGTSPNFRPMSVVAKRLDGSRRDLVRR